MAVIDTAAEVTIISDKVYNDLEEKPVKLKTVILNTAGRKMKMKSFVVGPANIGIGSRNYQENVYVAPIQDDMLLGLDLMRKWQVNINIQQSVLTVGGEELEMKFDHKSTSPTVSKVVVRNTVRVPPNSVMLVKCRVEQPMSDFILEPSNNQQVFIPRILYGEGREHKVCVVNTADHFVKLEQNRVLGQAEEIDAAVSVAEMRQIDEQVIPESTNNEAPIPREIPEHLKDLLERSSVKLGEPEARELRELLGEYQDVFAKEDLDLGHFTAIQHKIDTGDARPTKQRMRHTPLVFVAEEEANLKKMLQAKVIQPSVSEWASVPVLVRKRDGSVRWCVDYRPLNAVTVKDVFPLPLAEECTNTLAGNIWYSKLDANSAYWQVRIAEEDQKKTAFMTKYGLFEFLSMPYGLCNAPATFSRVMNLVLRGLNWNIVLAFLDDVLVLGKTFADHIQNLKQVLERFRFYQLKLKPKKCVLFQPRVEFLGRWVSEGGMELDEEQVKAVKNWPTPKNTKHVEQFLGLANYHRGFIKDYSKIAGPLYAITGKNLFRWDAEQETAFEAVKDTLTSAPVLAFPNGEDLFILDTDASDLAIGAELSQLQNGQERVISYGSFALSKEQRRYCVTRKELLAVVRFTRQYRHYLLGRSIIVRTDHSSLTWLLNFKNPQGQLARWIEELGQYDIKVVHRPGRKHGNADPMSRKPGDEDSCGNYRLGTTEFDLKELPCGGCPYCVKAHRNWAEFVEQVDDVVPLASNCPGIAQVQGDDAPPEDEEDMLWPWDIGGCWCTPGSIHLDIVAKPNGDFTLQESVCVQVVSKDSDQSEWIDGFAAHEDIKGELLKDPEYTVLMNWLTSSLEPSEDELLLSSPAEKYLWLNRETFSLKDGLLWTKNEEEDTLVIPIGLKEELMRRAHDIPSAGHQGIDRTKARIKTKYFWYGMGKDIKKYVHSCELCNHNKGVTRHAKSPLTLYHAGAPMERVHLDFLGPLPKTEKGNEHILMMVDQFTKWVECIPLPSQTAETTAQAAINEFFSRFGYPFQIFTDQGRNFESRLFTKVCELLQIHKSRTTAYRPSANGQVERFNRTLMDAVRCYVGKHQNQWDRHLAQIAGALRASVNRNTGYTPNKLMLGRELNSPAELMFPTQKTKKNSVDGYVTELEHAIKSGHEVARSKLKTNQKRMKRDYDVKVRAHTYSVGDLILMLDTASVKGKCRKLQPPWKGPYLVVTKLSSYLYRARSQNKVFTVNHDRMKRCTDSKIPKWIERLREQGAVVNQKDKLFCLCRKPDCGEFMIQCDRCEEWFHGNCVRVQENEAHEINKYICPLCKVDQNK